MKKLLIIVSPIIIIVILIGGNYTRKKVANYFLEKGNSYYSDESFDIKAARKWYNRSVLIYPATPYVHYQLARIYLVSADFEKGLAEINKEIEVDPEFIRAYYVKGLLDSYANNNQEAVEDFKTFIDWSPVGWAAYADLSWVYIKMEKYQEAIDTTNLGLKYVPHNPWLLSNQGLAWYRLGKYDQSKEKLEAAKNFAAKLTPEDWKKAYPGNNPRGAEKGVRDIRAIISYNLMLVYQESLDIENYLREKDLYNSLK